MPSIRSSNTQDENEVALANPPDQYNTPKASKKKPSINNAPKTKKRKLSKVELTENKRQQNERKKRSLANRTPEKKASDDARKRDFMQAHRNLQTDFEKAADNRSPAQAGAVYPIW